MFLLTVAPYMNHLSPAGKSAHSCVFLKAKYYDAHNKAERRVVTAECLSECVLDKLANEINSISSQIMYHMNDCQEQANLFYDRINAVIENIVPTCSVKIPPSDRSCNMENNLF